MKVAYALFLIFVQIFALSLHDFHFVYSNNSFSNSTNKISVEAELVWKWYEFWNSSFIITAGTLDSPYVGDVDKDGTLEIFKFFRVWHIRGFKSDRNASYINISNENVLDGGLRQTMIFGDFDGDGKGELAFVAATSFGYIDPIEGKIERSIKILPGTVNMAYCAFLNTQKKLFLVSSANSSDAYYLIDPKTFNWTIITITFTLNNRSYFIGTHFVPVDVNNDGIYEIFFLGARPAGAQQYLFNIVGVASIKEQRVLWIYNFSDLGIYAVNYNLYVGDFNGDSVPEGVVVLDWLYTGAIIFDLATGSIEKVFMFQHPESASMILGFGAFADLDGDGVFEGVFEYGYSPGSSGGLIAIVDLEDYSVEKLIYINTSMLYSSFITIGDFNLDGYYDILTFLGNKKKYFAIVDGRTLRFYLAFNATSMKLSADIFAGVIPFDIDGDGYIELVWGEDASYLFVVRLSFDPYVLPLIYWYDVQGAYGGFWNIDLVDADHDGLADWVEAMYGFNSSTWDSDGDGTSDRNELLSYFKNVSLERRRNISEASEVCPFLESFREIDLYLTLAFSLFIVMFIATIIYYKTKQRKKNVLL